MSHGATSGADTGECSDACRRSRDARDYVHDRPPNAIEADLLIIPVFEDGNPADVSDLDAASGGLVASARARGEFTGKAFELFVTVARGWQAGRVALVGGGLRKDFSADRLRRVAVTGGLAARERRLTSIALVHPSGTHGQRARRSAGAR